MQTYSKYRPTGFDPAGLGLDDRQGWLVLGVGRNRDSGPLDESNWSAALEILGGESDTCEVHRFGHWACGWFEVIILHPDREAEGEEIEGALANYPVLNEDDFSDRECEARSECWDNYGFSDCKSFLQNEYDLMDSTIARIDSDALLSFVERNESGCVESDGSVYWGRQFHFDHVTRDELAQWLLKNRAPRA